MSQTIHISIGGPIYKIKVGAKTYTFEMHRYSGPAVLNKDGEVSIYQPMRFLEAVTLWISQGKILDVDHCVWEENQ